MVSLTIQYNMKVEFTPEEFRLVCKGLRGTLDHEEMEDAGALQEALLRQRLAYVKSLYDNMNKLDR